MTFNPPSTPASLLARHRILSPTAGVRVSPLCLGAMTFGNAWSASLGECSKENAFLILDRFYAQGGNFIDTAVNYQLGESEQWLGEWMYERKTRDEIVLATKFTGRQSLDKEVIRSNYGGNSAKNIFTSVERSLKALRTGYIDIYYIHLFDYTTSIPEIMHALNDLCTARKVLYLGISDTPAWLVHGLRQFSIYQGRWSAAERSFEREIIPMCLAEGLAIAPWGALGSGAFKTKEQRENNQPGGRNMDHALTGKEDRVSAVLEKIASARAKHTPLTSVALAYVLHKSPYVFPIIGGRKVSHLESNIAALGLRLSPEEISTIDNAYGFEIGFPHDFISAKNSMVLGPEDNQFVNNQGFDFVQGMKPIPPHEEKSEQNR